MTHQNVASRRQSYAIITATVAALMLALAGSATAQTFTVTDEASFEAAVASVNSAGGANTIVVASGQYSPHQTVAFVNGTVTVTGPLPDPTVTVVPAKFSGASAVVAGNVVSVFSVASGAVLNLNNIQLVTAGTTGVPAIDDSGTLNLTDDTINGVGPSVQVESGATGSLLNSTIFGNDVGMIDDGTLTLTNSTVTGSPNGGIDNTQGTLNLNNSIVAKNGSPDCYAHAATSDHSLDGDGTCGVGALSSKNPLLGGQNLHGGSTPIMVPASGSPVIGVGDAAKCPAFDQHGAARPSVPGHACDIGSVETYYGVAPVLTNQNIKVGSPSATGTVATYTPTWKAGSPVTSVSCMPASGSTFAPGATTVTCTGTDSVFGASGTGTFTVTDVQATPPVVTTSGNQTLAATGSTGATATFTATATDAVDGTDPVACTAALNGGAPVAVTSGTTLFPAGQGTLVTCSATDTGGLTGSATFTITVGQYIPPAGPTFTLPNPLPTATATSTNGAVVTFTVTATDPADGSSDAVTCSPASGSLFAIGATAVNCSATTKAGVAGSASPFNVMVNPGSAPVVTVPADMSVAATMPGGAQVTYTVTATDPTDGVVPVTCSPASGSTFAIGTTTVNCTASDSRGNSTPGHFVVTVTESTPPSVVVPANIKTGATSSSGAKVSFTPTATDPVDGVLTPTCVPASGSAFPVGTTAVTCSATNKAGISAAASFTVMVAAPGAPVITVPAFRELGALTSAGLPVTYTVTATDQIDKSDPVTCTPPSGATFPIGDTTVMCSATNSAGKTSTASFDVQVDPPDNSSATPSDTFTLSRSTAKGHAIVVHLKLTGSGHVIVLATFKVKVKGTTRKVTYGRVSRSIGSGSKTLSLLPGKAGTSALQALGGSKKLALTITVKFTPKGGKASTKHNMLNVKP